MKEECLEMSAVQLEGRLPEFAMEEAVMDLVLEAKSWAEVELECILRLDDETGRVEAEITKLKELLVEIIQQRDDSESRNRIAREITRRRHYIAQIKNAISATSKELEAIRTLGMPWLNLTAPCQAMGSGSLYAH